MFDVLVSSTCKTRKQLYWPNSKKEKNSAQKKKFVLIGVEREQKEGKNERENLFIGVELYLLFVFEVRIAIWCCAAVCRK